MKAAAILTAVSALAIVLALPVTAIISTALMAKVFAGVGAGAVAGGIVGLVSGMAKTFSRGTPGGLADVAILAGSLVFGTVMGAALGGIGDIAHLPTLKKYVKHSNSDIAGAAQEACRRLEQKA